MWASRSHTLKTLTTLTPNKVNFKWTEFEQKPFEQIKRIVAFLIFIFFFLTGIILIYIACS